MIISASSSSAPPPPPNSIEAALEEDVRRYLARKPMTTTELLKKLSSKKTKVQKDELMPGKLFLRIRSFGKVKFLTCFSSLQHSDEDRIPQTQGQGSDVSFIERRQMRILF